MEEDKSSVPNEDFLSGIILGFLLGCVIMIVSSLLMEKQMFSSIPAFHKEIADVKKDVSDLRAQLEVENFEVMKEAR